MDALDQIDSQWRSGTRPNIAPVIERLRGDGDPGTCIEVCAADLEWRWRTAHQRSEQSGPHACEYASLLAELWNEAENRRRMVEAEWLARSGWGDQPDLRQFSQTLPDQTELPAGLLDKLAAFSQLTVVVANLDGRELIAHALPSRFVIGRQARHEPPPPAWLSGPRRLIVAGSQDRSLSRHQIAVTRTRLHEVELENTSRSVDIELAAGPLGPGANARMATPLNIVFSAYRLTLATTYHGRC